MVDLIVLCTLICKLLISMNETKAERSQIRFVKNLVRDERKK